MSIIAEYGYLLLVLACVFGLFMAWGMGANDVANAMGTSVGSRVLTVKQAIAIAMVFEFLGAYLAGGEVTSTIRKGIIDPSLLSHTPEYLIFGMLSALLAAGLWLLIASTAGWPVSTTHSIVGAIVGFAAAGISMEAVDWDKVGKIAASWLVSPLLAGLISFGLFRSVQHLILNTGNPFACAKRYIPIYMFAVGFMIAMMTLIKGLKHVFKDTGLSFSFIQCTLIATVVGIIVALVGIHILNRIPSTAISATTSSTTTKLQQRYGNVEKVFAVLMVFTACAMAFAHGSNDVANAVGPVAAIVGVVETGTVASKSAIPSWVLLLGGGGIVIGLATYGAKVMITVGRKITELTPSRGFAAELGAAATVVLASGAGLPISTTHTLVGSVLGVGMARSIGSLNLKVIASIFLSWIVTLPAGAALAIAFFFLFKYFFI